MYRALCWSVLLVAGALGARCAAFAQAAVIPLSLDVTASRTEVPVGETARFVVKLKGYKGDVLPATEPVVVTLHSELSGDAALTLNPGQSTADATVRFQRAGVATIVATAPKLMSSSVAVVVTAAAIPPVVAHAAPKPAAPVPSPTLAVDVLPQHVHP